MSDEINPYASPTAADEGHDRGQPSGIRVALAQPLALSGAVTPDDYLRGMRLIGRRQSVGDVSAATWASYALVVALICGVMYSAFANGENALGWFAIVALVIIGAVLWPVFKARKEFRSNVLHGAGPFAPRQGVIDSQGILFESVPRNPRTTYFVAWESVTQFEIGQATIAFAYKRTAIPGKEFFEVLSRDCFLEDAAWRQFRGSVESQREQVAYCKVCKQLFPREETMPPPLFLRSVSPLTIARATRDPEAFGRICAKCCRRQWTALLVLFGVLGLIGALLIAAMLYTGFRDAQMLRPKSSLP